jgi:hypothetical protein
MSQLGLMYQTPFFDDGGDLARQFTFAHFACANVNQSLKALVLGMNVWRWMIVVPHADDDSEKNRQGWHCNISYDGPLEGSCCLLFNSED